MNSIGKKLKLLSHVLLAVLLIALALLGVSLFTGAEGINGLLALIGVGEDSLIARYLPPALLILSALIVILLIVWTVRAFGQAVDCLEDIADAQEESARALKTLIERVEHLPVLKLDGRGDSPRKNNEPVSFRAPQQVFTTREIKKESPEPEKAPESKPEEKVAAPAVPAPDTTAASGADDGRAAEPAAGGFPVTPSGIEPSESWKCPGCGTVNDSKYEFCSACREKSLWKCERCGTVNKYNTDVCLTCGTRDTRPCPHCGNMLPRNRLKCDVCHASLE